MKNPPLNFYIILKAWERKRLLYNLIWLVTWLLILLIKFLQSDRVWFDDTFVGAALFVGSLFFINFSYTFTWVLNYVLYLVNRKLGYWIFYYGFFLTLIPPFILLLILGA